MRWHFLQRKSCKKKSLIYSASIFRFGPLPADIDYTVTAEKSGYILDKDDKSPYNFKVFKLAEVSVNVCSIKIFFYDQCF